MSRSSKVLGWNLLFGLLFAASAVQAQFDQPFKWSSTVQGKDLVVRVKIPSAHYLYADDRTRINVAGPKVNLQPFVSPETIKHTDEFGSGDIYPAGDQVWKYKIQASLFRSPIIRVRATRLYRADPKNYL